MKPTTVVALALMVPAMIGYLYYGWLLLETLSSEKGLLASVAFTNLFVLWLLPLIIGLILLALKLVKRKQHQKKEGKLRVELQMAANCEL